LVYNKFLFHTSIYFLLYIETQVPDFDVLLSVHLSLFISVINQIDPQNFCFTVTFLFHTSIYLLLYIETQVPDFDVLLTVHLSIFISVINQLEAQNFCFIISLFNASIYSLFYIET